MRHIIRDDNDIKDINIIDTTFVISKYADDTTIILDGG